jgi:hypothetical protein
LLSGYRSVLSRLYEPRAYYSRILAFLKQWRPVRLRGRLPRLSALFRNLAAAARLCWKLGVLDKGRRSFWRLVLRAATRYPKSFATALGLAAVGYHFRQATASFVNRTGVSPELTAAQPVG